MSQTNSLEFLVVIFFFNLIICVFRAVPKPLKVIT